MQKKNTYRKKMKATKINHKLMSEENIKKSDWKQRDKSNFKSIKNVASKQSKP